MTMAFRHSQESEVETKHYHPLPATALFRSAFDLFVFCRHSWLALLCRHSRNLFVVVVDVVHLLVVGGRRSGHKESVPHSGQNNTNIKERDTQLSTFLHVCSPHARFTPARLVVRRLRKFRS